MTEDVLKWLDQLKDDPEFGRVMWDAVIWMSPVEPVGISTHPVIKYLRYAYLNRVPLP